jgi:hypothetical protein
MRNDAGTVSSVEASVISIPTKESSRIPSDDPRFDASASCLPKIVFTRHPNPRELTSPEDLLAADERKSAGQMQHLAA